MRATPAWWIAVLICACTLEARAQAGGSDLVLLPGGGRLRGIVEVYEPGQRIVLLLPDGSRRTLGVGEFERVEFADERAATPAPVGPGAPMAEPDPVPSRQDLEAIGRATETPGIAPQVSPVSSASVERHYGDGRSAEVPWNDRDPALISLPDGVFHVGVQAAFAVTWFVNRDAYVGGAIAPYVDFRLSTLIHVRVLAILGFSDDHGGSFPTEARGNGVFHAGARPLLGLVLARVFGLRFGAEVGAELHAHTDAASFYWQGLLELALRLLDDERLEIVLDLAPGQRAESYRYRDGTYISDRVALRAELGVGMMF